MLIPGGLDRVKQAIEWVIDLLVAFINCFPNNQQPEETAGMENPPPYSVSIVYFLSSPLLTEFLMQSDFHTYHSVCSTSSDVTVTVQGVAAKV